MHKVADGERIDHSGAKARSALHIHRANHEPQIIDFIEKSGKNYALSAPEKELLRERVKPSYGCLPLCLMMPVVFGFGWILNASWSPSGWVKVGGLVAIFGTFIAIFSAIKNTRRDAAAMKKLFENDMYRPYQIPVDRKMWCVYENDDIDTYCYYIESAGCVLETEEYIYNKLAVSENMVFTVFELQNCKKLRFIK